MGLFFRKKKFSSDIRSLQENVEVLKTLTDDNALIAKLEELSESIRFSAPTTNKEVAVFDKRLANRLDDIKVSLASKRNLSRVDGMIDDINTIIAERNAKV